MGVEIERKFLVIGEAWRGQAFSETGYRQGYLANQSNVSVRVRIGGGKAFLNVKSAHLGIRRDEFEYPIPVQDAEEMFDALVQQPCIDKIRYLVRHGEHVWEIDVFSGANEGLVVAEIELQSEDEPFELPDWAGEEVSHDPRYLNVNLVHHPFRDW
jgi:adenylate cyclase